MGTELNEGICRRLGARWRRPGRLVGPLVSLLVFLVVLTAAAGAQALTLPALPTAGSAGSMEGGAAAVAGDTASVVRSVTAAATGAAGLAAPAPQPTAPSSPSTAGGSPVGTVQHQIAAAAQSVRAAVSGPVSPPAAPGGAPSAHPAPPVATDPPPVPTPSSVQQTVTAVLQRAGVTTGTGASDPVPVTTGLGPVAGTGGPQLDGQLLAAVGDLATRLGLAPRTLLTAARSGGSAVNGRFDPRARGSRLRADRHGSARTGMGTADGSVGSAAWRLSLPGFVDPHVGTWSAVAPAAGAARRLSAAERRLSSHRSRSPAADPAPPAPLPLVPAPGAPATAVGTGAGVGGAAVILFFISTIWLLRLVSDRISLEAPAWRETLLVLRLERPG